MTLFERGLISPEQKDSTPVEIRRGMTIQTREGQVVGKVAAVIVDNHRQNVTHLLFSQQHQTLEYRLVPVNLIEQVKEEIVLLNLCQQAIESLPLRQVS